MVALRVLSLSDKNVSCDKHLPFNLDKSICTSVHHLEWCKYIFPYYCVSSSFYNSLDCECYMMSSYADVMCRVLPLTACDKLSSNQGICLLVNIRNINLYTSMFLFYFGNKLWILFCGMWMKKCNSKITSLCFYHLRWLKRVWQRLGSDITAGLVSAFVRSSGTIASLHEVQNVATRFIKSFGPCDNNSPSASLAAGKASNDIQVLPVNACCAMHT